MERSRPFLLVCSRANARPFMDRAFFADEYFEKVLTDADGGVGKYYGTHYDDR